MDYSNISVLLLDGYARQILPMAKAFRQLGCKVTTLNNSKLDVGYASKYPNKKVLDFYSRDDYEDTLYVIRGLLKTGEYNLVVPMVDFSAALLSKHKEEFSNYARVASNDWVIFDIAEDKLKTMKLCMENNIPCPITLTSVDSIDDIKRANIKYPIVVKPRISHGGIGFKIIQSEAELQAFIDKNQINAIDYVFQEYIPQSDSQFVANMFVDDNNDIKSSLVFSTNRWFPLYAGTGTLSITVDRPDIIDTCTRLMKIIGWRGYASVDLIQDPRDGVVKVLEINPRATCGVKLCFDAGINIARQIIEKEYGMSVTNYANYRIGQRLRCSQSDLLWFINSPNRFRAKPSWFSIKDTKDYIFSINDPLPWLTFSIQMVGRYKNEMKKRQNVDANHTCTRYSYNKPKRGI